MVAVTTHSHLTNKSKHYNARVVVLWIDAHGYDEAQLIATIPLFAPLTIERVNKVDEHPNGILNVHII